MPSSSDLTAIIGILHRSTRQQNAPGGLVFARISLLKAFAELPFILPVDGFEVEDFPDSSGLHRQLFKRLADGWRCRDEKHWSSLHGTMSDPRTLVV
jgi:hypothetical protein